MYLDMFQCVGSLFSPYRVHIEIEISKTYYNSEQREYINTIDVSFTSEVVLVNSTEAEAAGDRKALWPTEAKVGNSEN
jgi:hypothetical protein